MKNALLIWIGVEIVWDNADCCEWIDFGTRIWHPPQIVWQGWMTIHKGERAWDEDQ